MAARSALIRAQQATRRPIPTPQRITPQSTAVASAIIRGRQITQAAQQTAAIQRAVTQRATASRTAAQQSAAVASSVVRNRQTQIFDRQRAIITQRRLNEERNVVLRRAVERRREHIRQVAQNQHQSKQENLKRVHQERTQHQTKQSNAIKQRSLQADTNKKAVELKKFNEQKQLNQTIITNRKRKADELLGTMRANKAHAESQARDSQQTKRIRTKAPIEAAPKKPILPPAVNKEYEQTEKIHKADALLKKMKERQTSVASTSTSSVPSTKKARITVSDAPVLPTQTPGEYSRLEVSTQQESIRPSDLLSRKMKEKQIAVSATSTAAVPSAKKARTASSIVPVLPIQTPAQSSSIEASKKKESIHAADAVLIKMREKQKATSLTFFETAKAAKSAEWVSAPPPTHFSAPKLTPEQIISRKQPKVRYLDRPMPQKKSELSNELKGQLAESHAVSEFESRGYELLPTKIRSNNGIDSFFIKKNQSGRIISVAIVESKFRSDAKVKLDNTERKGVQMSYGWLRETLKLMEQDEDPIVREAADVMRKQGNKVLDNRYVNLMTPDGNVKWFHFIKKKYDLRNFDEDPDDASDGELHEIDTNNFNPW